jgi:hypothetical protein
MKKYDKEYQTQWKKEVEFLSSVGIRYVFVKKEDDISVYKYKKDCELFEQLAVFYSMQGSD